MQQPFEGIRREVLKRGPVLHARIVDKDVDCPLRSLETVNGGANRVVIGHIEGQGLHCRTRAPQGFGGTFKLAGIASVQHDRRAHLGQAVRECMTNPLRRPGDKRLLAYQ